MNFLLIAALLLLSTLMWQAASKLQNLIYFLFAIIFSIIFANRDFITTADTLNYVELFSTATADDGWFTMIERYEPGFCFFIRVVRLFTEDYRVLFFIISFFNFSVFFYVVKFFAIQFVNSDYRIIKVPFLIFFTLYSSYYGILYNSVVMRGSMAMAFFFLASISLYNHKIIKGIVLYLFSVSFHQTVLLTLPLLFLFYFHFSMSPKFLNIVFYTSFILYVLNIRELLVNGIGGLFFFLYDKFPEVPLFWWAYHYVDNGDLNSFISLYMLATYFFIFVIIKTLGKIDRVNVLYCLPVLGLAFNSIFGSMSIFTRATDYLLIPLCVSFTVIASYNKEFKLGTSLNLPNYVFLLFAVSLYYFIFLHNVGMKGVI